MVKETSCTKNKIVLYYFLYPLHFSTIANYPTLPELNLSFLTKSTAVPYADRIFQIKFNSSFKNQLYKYRKNVQCTRNKYLCVD